MYTLGGAYQLHQDHRTGTLSPGKDADLIHTDRDLLRVNPREIAETQTNWTMIGGEVVYEAGSPTITAASTAASATLAATGARTARTRSHTACHCG
jgi:cytosine/adenosine deaminase-related metal-dependent hydrolase